VFINGNVAPFVRPSFAGPRGRGFMSGDLVSLRMLLVGAAPPHEDLWREGAAQSSVPIDFEAGNAAAAKAALSKGGVDFCVLDAELDDTGKASVIKAARAKRPAPLIFVSAPRGSARPEKTDGVLPVPANPGDAQKLVEICIRAKMPTRVLIVDESEALRGIVRKILAASRFELDIHEAADSTAALDQLRNGSFGMVFLDYNMPRLNGADILLGIKRESPNVAIVMMSSALNRGASGRPHLSGALGFLKKPFYPADVDVVLERYFGLHGSK
jgi:DNA-binding response OmpR family regulator